MIRATSVYGLLALVAVTAASAEDFPLTFQTIPAKQVMSFPGSGGRYARLQRTKPSSLKAEPRAVSRNALYGELRETPTGAPMVFRLDESKRQGHGYDQLIVDVNQNGDLTDDPVVSRASAATDGSAVSLSEFRFGPIEAPAGKMVAGGRPIYFAQAYIFNLQLLRSSRQPPNLYLGQLVLKPGWYLETTVELQGLKHKVGVIDGDSNFHLGDTAQPTTTSTRGEETWYFPPADSFLVDRDDSGSFENDPPQREVSPFGPLLYLGDKAFKVSLSADCKVLRVEPWMEALAEVTLGQQGDQVQTLTLAWQQSNDRWQLIQPAVVAGKIMVPPGDYRLYACNLLGKGPPADQVMVSGLQRVLRTPVMLAAGKANTLRCGAPLEIKVTAAKTAASVPPLLRQDTQAGSASRLRIGASVVGAGGELYSTFLKAPACKSRPSKPSFTIVEAGGTSVANGRLEYG